MLISFIVPVYNVQEYLSACVESILQQKREDIEIILVDDGSTDNSGNLCDTFAQRDTRVKVIHSDNKGVSSARNIGLRTAKGRFVTFVDSDDMICETYLSVLLKYIEQDTSYDIMTFNYMYWDGKNTTKPYNIPSKDLKREEFIKGVFIDNSVGGYVWNKIFKREILQGIYFNQELDICEDTYFNICVLSKNPHILYLSDCIYYYRLRANSAISQLENQFDKTGQLKYYKAYNQIEKNALLNKRELRMMYAGLNIIAVGIKCDYRIKHGKNKDIIKGLNSIIRKNFLAFAFEREIKAKKKCITIANAMFNVRRVKHIMGRNKNA